MPTEMEKESVNTYCIFYCDNLLLPLNNLSVVQSISITTLSYFEDSMEPKLSVVYAGDYCEIP